MSDNQNQNDEGQKSVNEAGEELLANGLTQEQVRERLDPILSGLATIKEAQKIVAELGMSFLTVVPQGHDDDNITSAITIFSGPLTNSYLFGLEATHDALNNAKVTHIQVGGVIN